MDKVIAALIKAKDIQGLVNFGFAEETARKMIRAYFTKGSSGAAGGGMSTAGTATISNAVSSLGGGMQNLAGSVVGALNGVTGVIGEGISSLVDGYSGAMEEDIVDLRNIAQTAIKNISSFNFGAILGETFTTSLDIFTKGVANAIAAEGQGRETVNRELGITGELAEKYRRTLVDAYQNTVLMGAEFSDIQAIVQGISESLGSAKLLSSSTIADVFNTQTALGVNNTFIAEAAKAFEDVSVGVGSVAKQLDKSGNYARQVGLNVKQFAENLTKHLTLLNSFGFKNGVDGMAKMVARAQSLRLEMSTITALADKVFNPEGAVELSAQLNAIGAGFGSLADPLKLVYQATNDMNGLQDSLVQAASSLATFNKQTGRFELTAVNMRKARDMAEALGMSYQDLANLAVRSAQKMEVASKIDLKFGNGISPEQKEFLKNMAEMKDGKMVISLPDEVSKKFGDAAKDGFLDISKLNDKGMEKVQEELARYQKDAGRKPTEIATDQLIELKNLSLTVKAIATQIGVRASRSPAAEAPKNFIRQQYTDQLRHQRVAEASEGMSGAVEALMKGNLGAVKDGAMKVGGALAKTYVTNNQTQSTTTNAHTKIVQPKTSTKVIKYNNPAAAPLPAPQVKVVTPQQKPAKAVKYSPITPPPAVPKPKATMGKASSTTSQVTNQTTNQVVNETAQTRQVNVDVDIHSSQTLYDDLIRSMLRDPQFLSDLKRRFRDTDLN